MLALLLVLACPPDPVIEAPPEIPASDPPVPLALYQQLYAGELGPAATRGDRLRLLVWLQTLEPSEEQAAALLDAHEELNVALDELRAFEEQLGEEEEAALAPIYAEIERALASGASDEELTALSERLFTARRGLSPPARNRLLLARRVLDTAEELLAGFDERQKQAMRHALFLLRPHADALGAPDTWEMLVGEGWREQDFASLRRLARPTERPGSVDVGGLFELDRGVLDPTDELYGARLEALVALALAHADLPEALALYEGS